MNKKIDTLLGELLVLLSCETGNSVRECIPIVISACNALESKKNKKLDYHFSYAPNKGNK